MVVIKHHKTPVFPRCFVVFATALFTIAVLASCNSEQSKINNLKGTVGPKPTSEPKTEAPTKTPKREEYEFMREDLFKNLVFNDEFDYEGKPDPTKWAFETGGHGWGNNEKQYYTDSEENAYVKDGKLTIVGKKQKHENNDYTSAKLITYGVQSFKYGRFEISAKLPQGKGSWPAIWMLPDSIQKGEPWPLCGEIDIMEHVGKNEDMIHVSLHSELYNHIKNTQVTHFEKLDNVTSEFHEYAFDWTEEYIEFFYDKRSVAKFYKGEDGHITEKEGWPFDQDFYLILNVAVGGNWGGEIDESKLPFIMEVDYVRIYQ